MTSNEYTAGWNAAIAAAVKWHEAEAERVRLLALNAYGNTLHRMLKVQDDHIDHAAAISALTVPSDMVAVPKEPTEAMFKAALRTGYIDTSGIHRKWGTDLVREIYRAMLKARKEQT